MNPERWVRIRERFESALELEPAQRDAHVAAAPDPHVRRAVAAMIRRHRSDDERLARVAADHATGEAAHALLDETPSIDGYRILRPLGRGGMGTVHLAERLGEDFRQLVAVKVLRPGMGTEDGVRRFQLERRTLASLRHDHIAGLLDGGVARDGLPFLVTEYVDGVPIDRYCREHDLSVEDRVRLLLPVCDAVAHAHRALVVHRDIKPSNVLVDEGGAPRLLDFGIAKSLDDTDGVGGPAMTVTGERPMTPRYASPEQVRGELVTVAADVHALGALLHELLTERPPFGDSSTPPAELERRILEDDPARPSSVIARGPTRRRLAAVRGDLDVITLKAMAKDPGQRYPGADAMAADLRRLLADEPIVARPPSRAYRARKFLRRHRSSVRGAAIAAGLLLVLSGIAGVVGVAAPARAEALRREAHLTLLGPESFDSIQSGVFWNCEPAVDAWVLANGDTLDRHATMLDRAATQLARATRLSPFDDSLRDELRTVERIMELRRAGTVAPVPTDAADLAQLDDAARRNLMLTVLLAGLPADVPRLLQTISAAGEPDPMVQGMLGQFLLSAEHPALAYPRLQAAMVAYPESELVALTLVEAAIAVGDLGRASRLLDELGALETSRESFRRQRVAALLAARRWKRGEVPASTVDELFQRALAMPANLDGSGKLVSFTRVTTVQFADHLLDRNEDRLALRYLARACNSEISPDIPFYDDNPAAAYARLIPLMDRLAETWTQKQVATMIRDARDRRGDPAFDPALSHEDVVRDHRIARTVALDRMLTAYARGRVSLPRRPARPVVLPGDPAGYPVSERSLHGETAASRLAARLRVSDEPLWAVIRAERMAPAAHAEFTPVIDRLFDAWADDDASRADAIIDELMAQWGRAGPVTAPGG